jgi:hypothetical protein
MWRFTKVVLPGERKRGATARDRQQQFCCWPSFCVLLHASWRAGTTVDAAGSEGCDGSQLRPRAAAWLPAGSALFCCAAAHRLSWPFPRSPHTCASITDQHQLEVRGALSGQRLSWQRLCGQSREGSVANQPSSSPRSSHTTRRSQSLGARGRWVIMLLPLPTPRRRQLWRRTALLTILAARAAAAATQFLQGPCARAAACCLLYGEVWVEMKAHCGSVRAPRSVWGHAGRDAL